MHCQRSPLMPAHAADVLRIELSADEILDEPDDQVVVHADLHAFAERTLASACALGPEYGRAVRTAAGPGRARRTGRP